MPRSSGPNDSGSSSPSVLTMYSLPALPMITGISRSHANSRSTCRQMPHGQRRLLLCGNRNRLESALARRDCAGRRTALGANRRTVGRVFKIAALEGFAAIGQNARADLEMRIAANTNSASLPPPDQTIALIRHFLSPPSSRHSLISRIARFSISRIARLSDSII